MQIKRKIVIFDFNRTLYDPNSNQLFIGTKQILENLRSRGFELYLISQNRDGRRNEIIENSNIVHLFKGVYVVPEKTLDYFVAIIDKDVDYKNSFVVGDFIRQEILFGNKIGLKTVWIKDDALSTNYPMVLEEQPNFTISLINQVLDIIK